MAGGHATCLCWKSHHTSQLAWQLRHKNVMHASVGENLTKDHGARRITHRTLDFLSRETLFCFHFVNRIVAFS